MYQHLRHYYMLEWIPLLTPNEQCEALTGKQKHRYKPVLHLKNISTKNIVKMGQYSSS